MRAALLSLALAVTLYAPAHAVFGGEAYNGTLPTACSSLYGILAADCTESGEWLGNTSASNQSAAKCCSAFVAANASLCFCDKGLIKTVGDKALNATGARVGATCGHAAPVAAEYCPRTELQDLGVLDSQPLEDDFWSLLDGWDAEADVAQAQPVLGTGPLRTFHTVAVRGADPGWSQNLTDGDLGDYLEWGCSTARLAFQWVESEPNWERQGLEYMYLEYLAQFWKRFPPPPPPPPKVAAKVEAADGNATAPSPAPGGNAAAANVTKSNATIAAEAAAAAAAAAEAAAEAAKPKFKQPRPLLFSQFVARVGTLSPARSNSAAPRSRPVGAPFPYVDFHAMAPSLVAPITEAPKCATAPCKNGGTCLESSTSTTVQPSPDFVPE